MQSTQGQGLISASYVVVRWPGLASLAFSLFNNEFECCNWTLCIALIL